MQFFPESGEQQSERTVKRQKDETDGGQDLTNPHER